jgi:hypothetical protein
VNSTEYARRQLGLDCLKDPYASREDAVKGMRELVDKQIPGYERLHVYRHDCGTWHVGHRKKARDDQ